MSDRTTHIAVADAGPTVADVMLKGPETYPASATVADARKAFESPRQKLLVVVDGTRYVGAVTADSLTGAADDTPLGDLAPADVPTVSPADPTAKVLELDLSRTPVVDPAGDLVGLVCHNRTRASFCVLKD